MKRLLTGMVLSGALSLCPPAQAGESQPSELDALRDEVRAMRAEYEARIAELEARLEEAEIRAASQPGTTAAVADPVANLSSPTVSVARDNSFNPAIGVTFQGQAWSYSNDPEGYEVPGFPLGGESGPAPEGLSLAESEITMSANVDDKFTAMLTVPIAVEDGEVEVELEEAWVETLGLPAGLSLRMGRFYSNIGYLNTRHFHSWDFADQPLPYKAFLGNQFGDDGLQLRWLAPTDFYLEFSGELLRGENYPAGGAAHSGVGAYTLGAKTGGDVGFSNSWQAGLSWLGASAAERASGDEDEPLLFDGDSDLLIADFVWKWSPYGNFRERHLILQAEYFWRDESGDYVLAEGDNGPWDLDQSGWYAQAVYQPFPRWRFGIRYDRLSSGRPGDDWLDTPLYPLGADPDRVSMMVDWSNSEFSRLRFQYNYDDSTLESDNQFGLQYIFSIGAHGAHSF